MGLAGCYDLTTESLVGATDLQLKSDNLSSCGSCRKVLQTMPSLCHSNSKRLMVVMLICSQCGLNGVTNALSPDDNCATDGHRISDAGFDMLLLVISVYMFFTFVYFAANLWLRCCGTAVMGVGCMMNSPSSTSPIEHSESKPVSSTDPVGIESSDGIRTQKFPRLRHVHDIIHIAQHGEKYHRVNYKHIANYKNFKYVACATYINAELSD